MSNTTLPVIPPVRGRGATANPTEVLHDTTRSIIARNDSPDVGFEYSVNPHRGCEHGCIYCFARPTHGYLGLSAGLDFETKIFAKPAAPALLREALAEPSWQPQSIIMSGVTDCYQPVERSLRITRGGGQLNDSTFGGRMRGKGIYAEQIRAMFRMYRKKYGLDKERGRLSSDSFRRGAG